MAEVPQRREEFDKAHINVGVKPGQMQGSGEQMFSVYEFSWG